VHASHELRLIERIRLDQEARRLLFSIEIIGPDGTTARHDFAFHGAPAGVGRDPARLRPERPGPSRGVVESLKGSAT
jgi:hypothetical protein